MANYLEEHRYFPTGFSSDDEVAESFMIHVLYRGRGKWAVFGRGSRHHQFDATGAWRDFPDEDEQLIHCRFDFATACALAEAAVETMEFRGQRWPQFDARRHGHAPAPDPEVEMLEASSG